MKKKVEIISIDGFEHDKKTRTFLEISFNGVVKIPLEDDVKSIQEVDLDILKRELKGRMKLHSMEIKNAKILKN